MATEVIRIVIEERGSKEAAAGIRSITTSAQAGERALNALRLAVSGVGVGTLVRQYIDLSNTYATLQNRIRLVTTSQSEQVAVSRALLEIANETFTSLEGTTELYARLAFNTRALGLTQREVLNVTRALNQAVILSGAGSREATNAIIQLSQGLASGTLRGDELRSVLEQLPFVADIIAKSMGVARDELRRVATEGKVTSEVIVQAFRDNAPQIQEQFNKLTPTIAQAFQVLKNNLLDFVGNANRATGLAGALSNTLLFLSKNVEIVTGTIILLGVALTALAITSIITGLKGMTAALLSTAVGARVLTAATAAFNAVLAFSPIGLFAIALAALIPIFLTIIDSIYGAADAQDDLNKTIGEVDSEAVTKSLAGYVRVRDELLRQQGVMDRQLSSGELRIRQEEELYKLHRELVQDQIRLSDSQGQELRDLVRSNVERRLRNELTQSAIDKQAQLQDQVRQQLRNPGTAREKDQATAPLINARIASGIPFDAEFNALLEKIRNSVQILSQTQFDESISEANAELSRQIELYDVEIGQRSSMANAQRLIADAQKRGVEVTAEQIEASDRLNQIVRALSIEDGVNQQAASIERSNEIEKLRLGNKQAEADVQQFLNGLLLEGETLESAAVDRLREAVNARKQIAADGLDKTFTEGLDEQVRVLGITTTQRQTEAQILQRRNDYLRIGVEYTKEQEQADRARLVTLDEQVRRQELLRSITGDRAANVQRVDDLNALARQETDPGRRRGIERAGAQARIDGRQGDASLFAGFENGIDQLYLKVSDVAGGIESAMTNAFSGAEDALVEFVQTGKFNFSGLVDSILADLTRLLARQALLAVFNYFSGGAAGAGATAVTAVAGARADGGPVSAGETYLVGERGPELFQAPQNGMIYPSGSSPSAAGGGNVTVINVLDPSMVTSAMQSAEGGQIIINHIGKNRTQVNRTLGTGG